MANYITVDGGTTNTRVTLVLDGKVFATKKNSVGARAGIDGTTAQRTFIKDAIIELIDAASIKESDIKKILASGMITSEFGLLKLDHIPAPAGVGELHDSMHEVVLSDISNIPFCFIRGVKLASESLNETDVMRGEETELAGLSPKANTVYVLPGSHSKIIFTDDSGRIEKFYTMLTGEMIYALSQYTILKDAVDLSIKDINEEYLLRGYRYASSEGLNEALFKVRMLKNIFACDKVSLYSFFLGAVLSGEIQKMIRLNPEGFVIAGKEQIKLATYYILKSESEAAITLVDADEVDNSVVHGAIKIYECK